MINRLKDEKSLKQHIRDSCEDEGLRVEIDGSLEVEKYVIVKVDDYYNNSRLVPTPPSVDFIASVDCVQNNYALYIMEFKNIKRRSGLNSSDISEKFNTAVYDFMSIRMKEIFCDDRYKYKRIFAYIIHPLKTVEDTYPKDNLRREKDLSRIPYKFRGVRFQIEEKNPSDVVIQKIG
jgi:hypothetical protein